MFPESPSRASIVAKVMEINRVVVSIANALYCIYLDVYNWGFVQNPVGAWRPDNDCVATPRPRGAATNVNKLWLIDHSSGRNKNNTQSLFERLDGVYCLERFSSTFFSTATDVNRSRSQEHVLKVCQHILQVRPRVVALFRPLRLLNQSVVSFARENIVHP